MKLISTPSTTPALFGGGLLGYVMYDCTHYYLHHGQPTKDPARHLKVWRNAFSTSSLESLKLFHFICTICDNLFPLFQRYHLNHHFRMQTSGFGITSSLWDNVFGTLPPAKTIEKSSWLFSCLSVFYFVEVRYASFICVVNFNIEDLLVYELSKSIHATEFCRHLILSLVWWFICRITVGLVFFLGDVWLICDFEYQKKKTSMISCFVEISMNSLIIWWWNSLHVEHLL